MSHCLRYQELMEDLLAGEISGSDQAVLEEHCAQCEDCAALMQVHENLLTMDVPMTSPERSEMSEMREAVLRATSGGQSQIHSQIHSQSGGFIADLARLWREHTFSSGLATAAVLVLAILGGRMMPQTSSLENELLKQAAGMQTNQQAGLDGYLDSPFTYANVSVRPQGQGQLKLSFDASRHVNMLVAQDSPLAKEVLLQAIMEPASLGSRLNAMEVTPTIQDNQLKEALIITMHNDPDPTVRLNALSALTRYPYNQRNQEALLQVLAQDQDVQLRLLALEELTQRNVGAGVIREAAGTNPASGTEAIMRQVSHEF